MSGNTERRLEGNRLGEETSLYLRQHADNPVAWQPWDERALELARDSGKPILLSIGYSACHWCHVMAHESFEDGETARVMNQLYVNIKVDREERPDLDKIYQLSHQLLTGRGGGWPLTLFLDPEDQVPFFAGTYFPSAPRYGMPTFREVLVRARQWFDQNPAEVKSQGLRLQQAIESLQDAPAGGVVPDVAGPDSEDRDKALIEQAANELLARFDRRHGGFGAAPKFPQAPLLELVAALADGELPASAELADSLVFSLERMAASGLRDHLDGGFFRYCVDGSWTIPHFEKMLYDNAQLLPRYAEAARRGGSDSLRLAAEGIAGWLQSCMLQDDGGYAASIDADAGGEEGGFHVWRRDEVQSLLAKEQFEQFSRAYGLDLAPNFEGKAWHLLRHKDARELAAAMPGGESGEAAIEEALQDARRTLLEAREQRVHPARDDKRLTSWNALAAGGLLRAGRALGRDEWRGQGQRVLDFIRDRQWDGERLLAVFNRGESRFAGCLDDYAFTLDALLESLRAQWRRDDLDFAIALADALLARFEDPHHGGFYFSDAGEEVPITRSIIVQDDATPAGYAIAIAALQQLTSLLGEPRYGEAAERALARARPGIGRSPMAFATAMRALMGLRSPRPQVVISGRDPQAAEELKRWAESRFPVNCYRIEAAKGGTDAGEAPKLLPGLLAEFKTDKAVTAWVCLGMKCLPPVHDIESLQRLLEV